MLKPNSYAVFSVALKLIAWRVTVHLDNCCYVANAWRTNVEIVGPKTDRLA
jgi:hypothetical protein